jgi:hypothetical protein
MSNRALLRHLDKLKGGDSSRAAQGHHDAPERFGRELARPAAE